MSTAQWLEYLRGDAAARLTSCRDDEERLDAVWSRVLDRSEQLHADELDTLVDERVQAAARTASAAAELELATAAVARLAPGGVAAARIEGPTADAAVLRQLLEGIAADRETTSQAVARDVLELLCTIALQLEVTERHGAGSRNGEGRLLAELHRQVTAAAARLRALPLTQRTSGESNEQVAIALRRGAEAYAGSLDLALTCQGGEPALAETRAALLWIVQELLHRLHHEVAGHADVTVQVTAEETTLAVTTPSPALFAAGADPAWLLRVRLRAALAGGDVDVCDAGDRSGVTVRLP